MNQRCPSCRAEVSQAARFCSNCGHSISQEMHAQARPQPRAWSFGNPQQINSTSSVTGRLGGGGSHTVLEMWSGLAAMLASILSLAAVLLSELVAENFALLLVAGMLLLSLALPGLHTRQAERSKRLGWVGFILAMIGVVSSTALFAFLAVMEVFFQGTSDWPWVGWATGVAGGVFLLGLAVLGIATVRANVLPRWAAVMFALGLPLGFPIALLIGNNYLAPPYLPLAVFYAGLAIFAGGLFRLGYALWARVRLIRKLSKRLPELSRPLSLRSRMPQMGFGDRTIWDWLDLLVVPIMIAIAGFWFTVQQDQRQQALEDQRSQDAMLQAYLDKAGQLMLQNHLRESPESSEVRTLARSRTLTVLERLETSRESHVLRFLVETNLVQSADGKDPVVGLDGAELSGATLSNFDLSGAKLSDANLSGAALRNADLSGTDLSGADLSGTDLFGVDLFGGANLHEADLRSADLSNADLSNAVLSYAKLGGADLSRVDLSSILGGATLSNADLNNADLSYAKLGGADLSSAKLGGADLSHAKLDNANLYVADLSNADLSYAELERADLSYAELERANLLGATGITETDLVEQADSLKGATMPSGKIRPGEYVADAFKPTVSFKIGEGWHLDAQETSDELSIEGPEGGQLIFTMPRYVFDPDPSNPSELKKVSAPENADEWASWFQKHPNLDTSGPDSVPVGNASGKQIDVTPSSTRGVDLYGDIGSYEGYKDRFIIVDVGGETVIINVFAPPDKFDEFLPKAQKILDSVEWKGRKAPSSGEDGENSAPS
jgi:uncharacterized protein YjbI with pentapeptide repeats